MVDTSLFKRMGVHDGRMVNEHLYGMPASWKGETGRDSTHSDKTCIKHGSVKDKANRPYYAKGGAVCGGPGSILSAEAREYHRTRKHYDQNGRQLDAEGGAVEPASIKVTDRPEQASIKVKKRPKFDPEHPFGIKKANGGEIFKPKKQPAHAFPFYADGGPVEAHSSGMFSHTGTYKPKEKPKPRLASKNSKNSIRALSEGGEVCSEKSSRRKRLAVGAVAKVRKGQY
jgi:hypothetical protein